MRMVNNIVIEGRLTADPEMRVSSSGTTTVRFILANNSGYKDSRGDEVTNFIPCVAWNNVAENIAKYVKKGDRIIIEGDIGTRTYDQDGHRQYITEIHVRIPSFRESKKGRTENEGKTEYNVPAEQIERTEMNEEIDKINDDGLPF